MGHYTRREPWRHIYSPSVGLTTECASTQNLSCACQLCAAHLHDDLVRPFCHVVPLEQVLPRADGRRFEVLREARQHPPRDHRRSEHLVRFELPLGRGSVLGGGRGVFLFVVVYSEQNDFFLVRL